MPKQTDLGTLIDLTRTTQTLLAHFQSSLAPSTAATQVDASIPPPPNTLEAVKACTLLLRSHTTTLSLLLLTPPLTPSAIITKFGDVSSGPLTGLVGAAVAEGGLGTLMQGEVKAQVRRLVGSWGEVVGLVLRLAERRQAAQANGNGAAKGKGKDEGPTESERADVLAATGVVWEACDALVKLCDGGIAGLVVKKAEEWRSVLLDAVEELKEWGEDVDDDEDGAEGSDGGFEDEDEIFGAANKLGKGDKKVKEVLDKSVKKLKMVGVLYQALIKRRLKTFPTNVATPTTKAATNGEAHADPLATLDDLMKLLRSIPEQVDELAEAFYDLDEDEAQATLDKCCGEAKNAASLAKQGWAGKDDEFTLWSAKWVDALNAA